MNNNEREKWRKSNELLASANNTQRKHIVLLQKKLDDQKTSIELATKEIIHSLLAFCVFDLDRGPASDHWLEEMRKALLFLGEIPKKDDVELFYQLQKMLDKED